MSLRKFNMTISDLIQNLLARPDPKTEVNYVVYEKANDRLVCISLDGAKAAEVMNVLARKTAPEEQK